jgi:hypothetical protein
MDITTRCGQDSDCNPASAGGILGVMLGWALIPDPWKSGIPALADTKFSYTDYSFNSIVRSTMDRALKVVQKAGGKVTERELLVPAQSARAPKLELWDMGAPERIIPAADPAWNWKGAWTDEKGGVDRTRLTGKLAQEAGAEAALNFSGTAVQLVGPYSQAGGRADVYLDGKKDGEINAYIVERTNDSGLWHRYGLRPGPHALRIVTRNDADPRSTGKKIVILAAIPFNSR